MKTKKIAQLIREINYEGRAISTANAITEEEELLLTLLLRKMNPASQAGLFVSEEELEKILPDNRDSFDQALQDLVNRLMNKIFSVDSAIKVGGTPLRAHCVWFQSIVPKDKDGVAGVEFLFTRQLMPFLIQLKKAI